VLTSTAMTARLLSTFGACGIAGSSAPALAQALGTAFVQYLSAMVLYTQDVGAAGVGQSFTPCAVSAPGFGNSAVLGAALRGIMTGVGLVGTHAPLLAEAVAQGFCVCCAETIQFQGTHTGVGSGAGVGVLTQTAPLLPLLQAQLAANGLSGSSSSQLALALAQGVSGFVTAIPVTVPIVGASGPAPASGLGIGKVL